MLKVCNELCSPYSLNYFIHFFFPFNIFHEIVNLYNII